MPGKPQSSSRLRALRQRFAGSYSRTIMNPPSSSDSIPTRSARGAGLNQQTFSGASGMERRTTLAERILLIAVIVTLPLQDQLPSLGGLSVSSMLFAIILLHL